MSPVLAKVFETEGQDLPETFAMIGSRVPWVLFAGHCSLATVKILKK